jgi:uncharacterized membrane protein
MFDTIITFLNTVTVNTCQLLAMLIILVGIFKALYIYVKNIFCRHKAFEAISDSRMEIGYSFSLGLSFLIGASILKTIIAPSWYDIGQLASIIAIPTALNYFLLHSGFKGVVRCVSQFLGLRYSCLT